MPEPKKRWRWCSGCGDPLTGADGEAGSYCRWCHMDATDDGREPEDEDDNEDLRAMAEDAHEAKREERMADDG